MFSYKIGYLLIGVVEKHLLGDWREAHGMPRRRLTTAPDYTSDGHRVPVIYATSTQVMPRPENWDEHIYQTGFWFDEEEPAWEPPAALTAFLEQGEAPVYIGFGSMRSGDMQRTYAEVLRAVHASGVRAIVNLGWAEDQVRLVSNNRVWFADAIPHSWLFPRVQAVVHHGGCGTTAAGLKAGKPTLIIPFGGDQPYWGNRVAAIGCGPKPIQRTYLTARKLAEALVDLTSDPSYRENARRVAAGIAKEGGVRAAADIAEAEIAAWRKSDSKE
jgi:sterol 3beta-glucosyltransferase